MKNLNNCRGISLMEIIVAMYCTALLLALVCRVLPLARRQCKEADLRLGGAIVAQNALEEYLTVKPEEWPHHPLPIPEDGRTIKIEALSWPNDVRLRLARVTVWVGEEETYRLETLVNP